MKKLLKIIALLFLSLQTFSQRMSPDHYWVPLIDKTHNSYSIDSPEEFLSDRAILRRQKANISIDESDLPVSDFYIDSLKSLGLKIKGSSKWENAVLIETTDSLLMDSLNYLDFVAMKNTDYGNFASETLDEQGNSSGFENASLFESDYGYALPQIEIIGGIGLHELGFRGEGKLIAVLDGGFLNVDSLDYFNNLWENDRIIAYKDFVNPDGNLFKESYHGMSVLSTMSVNVPGLFIGMAPEASFVLLRTEDVPTETKVEEAYWLLAAEFADSIGADIITTSLGYTIFDFPEMNYEWENLSGDNAFVTRAAENAFSKGLIVVTSAGNEGDDPWEKITTPADGNNVLAVGSIDTLGNVSEFSSRGLGGDNQVKPDVLAVGFQTILVRSTGELGTAYGTSFSSPQISGLAACLWQAMPDKTNLEIIEAIRESANRFAYPDIDHGYGIPNFTLALWILNKIETTESRKDIQIYPNPFTDNLYIKAEKAIESITIYSLSGNQLYTNHSGWDAGEIIRIENSGIKYTGVYLLVTKNNKETIVSKIFKK